MVEPPRPDDQAAYARPKVLASWLILVLFGSFAAFTIFLRLLNDRGPVGAGGRSAWGGPVGVGMYAFVSPVVAVALGGLVLGERFGPLEALGLLLVLGAAWLALTGAAAAGKAGAPSSRRSGCAAAPPRGCR